MFGFNPGRASADFAHVDVMPRLVAKTGEYLAERAKEPSRPFFLFFAATGVHNPIVPAPNYTGRSVAGPYGDFIASKWTTRWGASWRDCGRADSSATR